MLAASAGIEELVGVAAVIAESLHLILHSVTVHEVHDNHDACLVRFVNQLLEFLGRAEAA